MPNHPPQSDRALLFLHIPKAGGSTLNYILHVYHARNDRGVIYYPALGIQREYNRNPSSTVNDMPVDNRLVRFISGHFTFGLHRFLTVPATYITLLRDPVDRVVSLYYHVLRSSHEPLHQHLLRENISLSDFVTHVCCREAEDDQTWRLSGLGPDTRTSPQRMLALAKENIRQYFSISGVTERFDETVVLLKRTLGWQDVSYAPKLVNESRPHLSNISPRTRELIATRNELDIELYEWVKTSFDEAVQRQGSAFADELTALRRLNAERGSSPER